MIELRRWRQFVTLADELHFGHAATRLHMTQPPLTQAIQGLERALGTALFMRNRRSVALTPAGAALLPAARPGGDPEADHRQPGLGRHRRGLGARVSDPAAAPRRGLPAGARRRAALPDQPGLARAGNAGGAALRRTGAVAGRSGSAGAAATIRR